MIGTVEFDNDIEVIAGMDVLWMVDAFAGRFRFRLLIKGAECEATPANTVKSEEEEEAISRNGELKNEWLCLTGTVIKSPASHESKAKYSSSHIIKGRKFNKSIC